MMSADIAAVAADAADAASAASSIRVAAYQPPIFDDGVVLNKLLQDFEYEFIAKCREVLGEMTGEKFLPMAPNWLKYTGAQLAFDGLNARLHIAIDYNPGYSPYVATYDLPPTHHALYSDLHDHFAFSTYLFAHKLNISSQNDIAVIVVPGVMNDELLRQHFSIFLGQLTKFRPYVGSPRIVK